MLDLRKKMNSLKRPVDRQRQKSFPHCVGLLQAMTANWKRPNQQELCHEEATGPQSIPRVCRLCLGDLKFHRRPSRNMSCRRWRGDTFSGGKQCGKKDGG